MAIDSQAMPRRLYHWNYRCWVLETATWVGGTAFIDATTVLPVLVLALSHSPFLAGLIISIRYAGQSWPQLIAASLVSGKPRKPFFFRVVLPGRLALLWPGVVLLLGMTRPAIALSAVLLAYLAFWISEGFSVVPWVDMVGNTIPPRRRGRMFASMYSIGGLLGIGAGLLVNTVLHAFRRHFPGGYGLLFVLAFCGVSLSTLAIVFLREPPPQPHEERYSTLALIKDIPHPAAYGSAVSPADRAAITLRVLAVARALLHPVRGPARAPAHARSRILRHLVFSGGANDRDDLRQCGVGPCRRSLWQPPAAAPAGGHSYPRPRPSHCWPAVLAGHAPGWMLYLALTPTFFGFCVLQGGTWMGVTNYLLDIAPAHDRPAFIAVGNALNIPAVILPMVGGLLLARLGYQVIFLIAVFFLCLALVLTFFLVEPRTTHTYYHAAPPEAWG